MILLLVGCGAGMEYSGVVAPIEPCPVAATPDEVFLAADLDATVGVPACAYPLFLIPEPWLEVDGDGRGNLVLSLDAQAVPTPEGQLVVVGVLGDEVVVELVVLDGVPG